MKGRIFYRRPITTVDGHHGTVSVLVAVTPGSDEADVYLVVLTEVRRRAGEEPERVRSILAAFAFRDPAITYAASLVRGETGAGLTIEWTLA